MPSQHKHNPVPFRPPEGDRSWLLTYAEATGQPVNAVLVAALGEYRARHGGITEGGITAVAVPPGDTTTARTPPRPELTPEPPPKPQRQAGCTHKRKTSSKGGRCPDCGAWAAASN